MAPTKRKGSLLSTISKIKKPRLPNSRRKVKNIPKDVITLIKKIDEWTKAAYHEKEVSKKFFLKDP